MARTPSTAPRAKKTPTRRAAAETPPPAPFPLELPLLPIRDNVHFPGIIFPLFVGREKSVRALDEAMAGSEHILLMAQKQVATEDPETDDLHEIGIVAEIIQILKVPDGTVRVMLEGKERVRVTEWLQTEPFFGVRIERLPVAPIAPLEAEALMRSVMSQFEQIANTGKNIPPEVVVTLLNIEEPGSLADHVAWHLPSLRVEVKQELLEILDPQERLQKLSLLLTKEFGDPPDPEEYPVAGREGDGRDAA